MLSQIYTVDVQKEKQIFLSAFFIRLEITEKLIMKKTAL